MSEHTGKYEDPMDRVMKEMRDLVDEARVVLLATARHNIFRPYTRRELEAMAGLPHLRKGMTSSHVSLAFNDLERDGKCWTDKKLRVCFYPKEWDGEREGPPSQKEKEAQSVPSGAANRKETR